MEKIHLPQPKVNELHAICKEHDNDPGELINILHAAQEIFGYLPREVQEMVAAELHIPVSRVYGVMCGEPRKYWTNFSVNWKSR